MIAAAIPAHMAPLGLHPATVAALQIVAAEADDLRRHSPIAAVFATLPDALGVPEPVAAPFRAAWTLFYATIGRLDSLQDGDPIAAVPGIDSPGAAYNLVFASYVLATSLLHDLVGVVPLRRFVDLQRWWVACVLQMADGQQRDLMGAPAMTALDTLADYQAIAQAKTGATYALACGGLALLGSDDADLAGALAQVGALYGSLVQYADDLHDAAAQPNATLTLATLLRTLPLATPRSPAQVDAVFWHALRPIYQQAAMDALTAYPALHAPVTALFAAGLAPAERR